MQSFDYDPAIRVLFGENSVDRLGELARELDARRVLLVTDPGLVEAGHAEHALQALRKSGCQAAVFSEVEENPTTRVVEAGTRFAQENSPIECIVGLGGGSSMDCAKGINFLLTNGGEMEDYQGMGKASKPMLPSLGVPTTAGTGSEAQSFALISQRGSHIKMACGDKKARFRAVILDPALTASMPRQVAAVTAMDAVSHALESYVTTRRNPVSQMLAREAWRLLAANFEAALENPQDAEVRGRMLLGAHWAGAAIENSMLGAAHATANPLTARYDITHGIAVGLMLPHVVRFNASVAGGCYHELLNVAGAANGNPKSSPERLSERLVRFKQAAGLPLRLRDCGVRSEDLPLLAQQATEQWTGNFNPRKLDQELCIGLYERAF